MALQPIMLRLARPIGSRARTQALRRAAYLQRHFADRPPPKPKDSILSSDPVFLPGSQSPNVPVKTEVPLGPGGPGSATPRFTTPATPSSASTIPPQNVPLMPPSPSKVQTAPPTSTTSTSPKSVRPSTPLPPSPPPPPPPASQPPPKPRRRRSWFGFLLYLTLFGGLTYGGAVAYALRNDNFHDFFTEYVPFGEESVLYFEERSFRSRFPNARPHAHRMSQSPKAEDVDKVTIPSKSGLSWRVTEDKDEGGSDVTQKGRHMSAVNPNEAKIAGAKNAQENPKGATPKAKTAAVDKAKKDASSPTLETKPDAPAPKAPVEKSTPPPPKEPVAMPQPSPATPSPQSDPRPPAIPPVTQISPLEIANAEEPLVQDLVKIVNDIITVVNADSADASNKYSAPLTKAKESLASVGARILALKEAERQSAEDKVVLAHKEFDEGAKELLRRIETAQREDDVRYREEFEAEKRKLQQNYNVKLKAELDKTQQVTEQKLKNEFTEQMIDMKRQFINDVQNMVEQERDGRLSKLTDLSSNVDNLQQLTSNWNGVIDTNLATQKLQVAVDAVRSALSRATASEVPRPFVREMAALKLVADGDPVVDAAIGSINPSAYQQGIPSPAQLIDRFRRVASEVRKASLLPEDAGVASHAASFILSRVMFKKHGQPQGNDVESVLTRTETLLEEGNLDGAAREMNTLQGWAGVLSKDWLQDCRKVLEVRQALEVIETEARLQCLRVE